MRPPLAAAAVIALLAIAPRANAQSDAQAERLFDEGRALMDQGRYTEACAKLLASEKAAPSGGTLLNLADCYEKDGKLASAWARFKEAAARAAAAKRPDVEAHALDRARALAPRLATITVIVPPESDIPGLVVKRDADPIDRAAWDTALPVDTGEYDVEASAPSHDTWKMHVSIATEAQRAVVSIPKLAQPLIVAPPLEPPSSTQRTIGLAVAAGGVVAIGFGAFFGLEAKSKNDDALAHCPQSPRCLDAEGPSLTRY
jgi:hypothetical protein